MQRSLFEGLDGEDAIVCGDITAGPAAVTLADARPYQIAWRDDVLRVWDATAAPALGVAATGVGKSMGCGLLARDVLDGRLDALGHERRLIAIAHRAVLVRQLANDLTALLPDKLVEVEMGDYRATASADVVVACIDSLSLPRRLRYFAAKHFAAVLWDECHRYGKKSPKVKRLLEHFGPRVRHLGVTATPDRTARDMPFTELAFDYPIHRAVDDGWLVPPHVKYEICHDLQLSRVKDGADGDFDADALGELMQRAGPLAAVVEAARKWRNFRNAHAAGRPTVITCARVAHAELVANCLNEWHAVDGGGNAAVIHCGLKPDEKAGILRDFKAGKLRYITHFDMLTEGFDSDLPKVLVNGRPTKRRWVVGQSAGRVLRPARGCRAALAAAPDAAARRAVIRASDKPGAMIVDVTDGDHSLAVDVLSVLAASASDTEAVHKRAKKKIWKRSEAGLPADVMAELAKAREEERAERKAEELKKWSGVLVGATMTTRAGDPYAPPPVAGRGAATVTKRMPSAKMKAALVRAGVPADDVSRYSHYKAKKMMQVVSDRRDKGLSSYPQIAALRRLGLDGNGMTFAEASAALDAAYRAARSGPRQGGEA